MEKCTFLLPLSFLFFSLLGGSQGVTEASQHAKDSRGLNGFSPSKLFVFGDSYGDTGNGDSKAHSWNIPYGMTVPGKPDGRFSDGHVITDYLVELLAAGFSGFGTPITYRQQQSGEKRLNNGINFAAGGTGVFDTMFGGPNMSTQIGHLQDLINQSAYTKEDMNSSVVLVILSGNDYATFNAGPNASAQGFLDFIPQVVNQLKVNLEVIGNMGPGKVIVAGIEPLGCLPEITMQNSFTSCNETVNLASQLHNSLLKEAVTNLNNEFKSSPYVMLDLYDSFFAVLNNTASITFQNPYKPCCMGIGNSECGDTDQSGNKLYTVCSNPLANFFWDMDHPSHQGWNATFLYLEPLLKSVFSS